MVVKIFVTYCGGWNYGPKYDKFKLQVTSRLPEVDFEFDSYATHGAPTGFFEVQVNGELVHSKDKGDGYVDTEAKLEKILNEIKAVL